MKVTWHLTHPKCTHTVNTHLEQWAAIYAAAPGEQLGVRCLAQGHLGRGIEGGESAVHSLPHLQFLPTQDSNSQPFDYESDGEPDMAEVWSGSRRCLCLTRKLSMSSVFLSSWRKCTTGCGCSSLVFLNPGPGCPPNTAHFVCLPNQTHLI